MNEAIYMEEETRCDPENIPEKRCYTVEDLQMILDVSRGSVYSLLKRKEFKWFQIGGGRYRISKKSFDSWLDEQT
jgi:excisionase family DNA binding protein